MKPSWKFFSFPILTRRFVLQTPTSWVDYDNIRPCCGDTNWLASSGYTIPGVGAFGTSAPTPAGVVTTAPTAPSPTPGGDTGTDAPTGGSTACASGNDNTGKKCPPDTANGPCPPGCEPDEDEDEGEEEEGATTTAPTPNPASEDIADAGGGGSRHGVGLVWAVTTAAATIYTFW